jgi:hypothetical protein
MKETESVLSSKPLCVDFAVLRTRILKDLKQYVGSETQNWTLTFFENVINTVRRKIKHLGPDILKVK